MKEKIYLATIIDKNEMFKMIVSGYGKKSVEKKIIDFLYKTNSIKDLTEVDIYLKQIVYTGKEYVEVE